MKCLLTFSSDLPDDDVYSKGTQDDNQQIYEDLCSLKRKSNSQVTRNKKKKKMLLSTQIIIFYKRSMTISVDFFFPFSFNTQFISLFFVAVHVLFFFYSLFIYRLVTSFSTSIIYFFLNWGKKSLL